MTDTDELINHPKHYAGIQVKVECIDISRRLPFQLGNAVKYVWRAGRKGDAEKEIEDLRKAIWYLEDYDRDPCGKVSSETLAIWSLVTCSSDNMRNPRAQLIDIILTQDAPDAILFIERRLNELGAES